MKKYLFLIASIAFVSLTSCSNKQGLVNVEPDNKYIVGAYADYRSLSDEERQLFDSAYSHQAKLTPQSVATQVVAGTNCKFICTDASEKVVEVVIFKPLPNQGELKVSSIEPISGYEDIISSIRKGFEDEWQTKSPEEIGVSYIYQYRSPSMGFVKADINGDGILELLLGDSMDAFYDIFTYDAEEGIVKHVFCGGERDKVKFNGSWVISREGSNSASDSFTIYYRLMNNELVEVKEEGINDDLLDLPFEPFDKE